MATLVENKKVRLDHEILEEYEGGLELFGFEVKSLRAHRGNLAGAYVTVSQGGAFLVHASIPHYQPKNTPAGYDPERRRRILLSRKEIAELIGKESQKGLTIVPLSVYTKGRYIKVKIAVVRGKKKHDKRQDIKKRDVEKELKRSLKQNIRL